MTTMDMVRLLVSAQLLVTAFLAVLLWSLHARLRRQEFNRWWASAWTLYALFLGVGRLALAFPPGWGLAKGIVVLLATLLGFLVAPALVFGAVCFRSRGTITRSVALAGLGAALVLGTLSFAASLLWAVPGLTSFAVRHGLRTSAVAAALLFCSWVFFERVRATKSRAALLTGVSCVLYGVTHLVYTGAFLVQLFGTTTATASGVGRLAMLNSARLLSIDVVLTCGICLGMVLLLVEEYQRSARALVESVSHEREVAEENTALQSEIRSRQDVERQLRASEDRYRDLVDHSEDLLCTHDLDGRILSCNPAPARILGYSVPELLTMSIRDLLAPDRKHEFDDYMTAVQRDGVAEGVMKVVTRHGERRVWLFRNTLRTDGVAAPIVRGMARDVTEQQQAERAQQLSEEKFAVAFRSSPCAKAIISGSDGRFIDVNEAFESHSGYSRAELLNRTSLEMNMWSDPADRAALHASLAADGRLQAREVRFRHKNGGLRTIVFSAEVVQVGGDKCILLAGLDITARKDAEARHQAMLRALPDWVFLTTPDGVFLECHAKDQRHLLIPPAQFIGRHVRDVLPADLATRLEVCFHEAVLSEQPATLEYSLPIGDELRFYEVRSVRVDASQVLSLVRDVTDQKRAEHRAREMQDELAHAGRVMALGALTGSLAHEINQPLTAISINAYVALNLLEAEILDVAGLRNALRDIVSGNQRIDDVLRRLRGLLRKERRDHAAVDVNTIVNDVLKLVHSDFIERRIAIDVALGPDLPAVLGDRIQLQQVVLNILMNAAEAVSTAPGADDRHITVTTAAAGREVTVSVADRGMAVSDAEFDQLFNPFFTTKRDGMGLGLSICRTIITAHGGHISARRNPDRGLTCWFALDRAPAPNLVPAHASGAVDAQGLNA
jgi:PAS domain S-box-containing protein